CRSAHACRLYSPEARKNQLFEENSLLSKGKAPSLNAPDSLAFQYLASFLPSSRAKAIERMAPKPPSLVVPRSRSIRSRPELWHHSRLVRNTIVCELQAPCLTSLSRCTSDFLAKASASLQRRAPLRHTGFQEGSRSDRSMAGICSVSLTL